MRVWRQGDALVFRVGRESEGEPAWRVVADTLRLKPGEAETLCRNSAIRRGRTALGEWDPVNSGNLLRVFLPGLSPFGPERREGHSLGPPTVHPKGPAGEPGERGFPAMGAVLDESAVLFEDDHLLVVDKPARVIVHPDGAPDWPPTLSDLVNARLERVGGQPPSFAAHRLDRDTTGVCLFAKHRPILRLFGEMMERREVSREYVALVEGRLSGRSGEISLALGRDRHVSGKMRPHPAGKAAVTQYEAIWRGERATLLRLTLRTGRRHQIRVHLSAIGHPVIGDALYGKASEAIGRQALHAIRIAFEHPYDRTRVSATAPLPADFSEALRRTGVPSSAWAGHPGLSGVL